MANSPRQLMGAAALFTIAASGCFTSALAASNSKGKGLTLDERFVRVAERVPEFGGMYLGKDQKTLWVWVTKRPPHIIARLRHALQETFPGADLPARIRLRKGNFAFDQLKRWKD